MYWNENPRSRYRRLNDLQIYRIAKDLAASVYSATKSFPKHELYGMTSQLNRAAVSIGANIAEGNGRRTYKDQNNFMTIAKASLSEVIFLLDLSLSLDYIDEAEFDKLMPVIQDLDVRIYNYIQSKTE